jgi:hypothetical protein
MNFTTFCDTYFCEDLEEELEIWYDITDYDPSVGVDYEFEFEALDSKGKDRYDDLNGDDEDAIYKLVKQHIRENVNSYDDF